MGYTIYYMFSWKKVLNKHKPSCWVRFIVTVPAPRFNLMFCSYDYNTHAVSLTACKFVFIYFTMFVIWQIPAAARSTDKQTHWSLI